MKRFVLSYSCGKDSTLALHRLIKRGNKPLALIVTVNKEVNRSWFHGVPDEVLNRVSKSLDIPLIKVICSGNEYESEFEKALVKSKELGATTCAFGDIDIIAHRKWCDDRCKNVGMESEFPLWQEDREEITNEVIQNGFKAMVKCCNNKFLGEHFLGEILTKDLIQKIKDCGADACGENGEYHTFVFDGPIFKEQVKFKQKEIFKNNGYNHLIIEE
ncbi:MAG: diphthine--ammonia ligase [Clostridium sp.]|uniref:Dph6-related ATP pyrophosphatase n=1 Tax=Clostridium sp. TaxID=1506 RepID=UPI003F314179